MYSIDYDKIISEITSQESKRVMVQLPDGMKNKALEILQRLNKDCPNTEVLFWAGSNFGACDLPVGLEKMGVDLLIHLGHTEWVY